MMETGHLDSAFLEVRVVPPWGPWNILGNKKLNNIGIIPLPPLGVKELIPDCLGCRHLKLKYS